MAPIFLSLDEVYEIHRDQIARYGGSPGVREAGLLESAVAQPGAGFGGQFFHADLFEMAAAYLYHIVQNHPFVDGNKRVGTATALVFLDLNGSPLNVPEADLVEMVLNVAQGKTDKAAIATFFRKNTTQNKPADGV